MPEFDLIPLTFQTVPSNAVEQNGPSWKRLIIRHFSQWIIQIKKVAIKEGKKHVKVLHYHKCMHFPKQGVELS